VIEMLIDIVSKNGNLLLNFTQMPDGSLDEQCRYILACMAQWTAVNGEGIYGTRPWVTFGDGPSAAPPANGRGDPVRARAAWPGFAATVSDQPAATAQTAAMCGRLPQAAAGPGAQHTPQRAPQA